MVDKQKLATALLVSASFGSILVEQPAAQDTEGAERVFETVTVTAQKREQSLTDVGISISVVDAEAIKDRRLETPSDLVSITPNATVKEQFPGIMPVVTIRGIGLNDFNATNSPAAGVYIDEVPLSSLALLSSDLIDLERMEVLKGPQGTVYGRNSTAGALNIVSAKPNFDGPSGRLKAGIGNFDFKEVEGMANIQASDQLAFRFTGKKLLQDEGFYFDETLGRDTGRRDVLIGRASTLWQASDAVSVLLKVEGQQARSELGAGEFFGALPTATETNCPGLPTCSSAFLYTDTDGDPFTGAFSTDPDYNFDQVAATSRIEADLGFATLTSVTGYINFSRDYFTDTDASPAAITDFQNSDDVNQISQELRLAGSDGPVDWQAGLFYAEDNVRTIYGGDFTALLNATFETRADQTSTSKAIFGNLEYVLNDQVSLVGGLRFSDEVRAANNVTSDNTSEPGISFLSFAAQGTGPVILASVDDEVADDSLSWKLGINWKPSENSLVYASATEGFKSGGFFGGPAASSIQLIPYDQESLIAYEVGVKGVNPPLGLTYDASAFFYDYSDVQTFIRDNSGFVPVQRLSNVDEAEVYGLDLYVSYQPAEIDGLSLFAAAGLLSTELGAFEATAGPVPAGNKLPDAPDLSLNLGSSYTTDLSNDLSLTVALDGQYQSDTFRDALNDPILESEGYWVANAQVSLFSDNDWRLTLWGKNLADEEYVIQGTNLLDFTVGYRSYGAPRTFGLSLEKEF